MNTVNMEREKAKRRIMALLNKTADKGATEHESQAAAEKVAELMGFYNIEFGELEFQEKNIVKVEVACKAYLHRILIKRTAFAISKFCQVRCWSSTGTKNITYLGFKHDVEIAQALHSFIEESALRCLSDFIQSPAYSQLIAAGQIKLSITSSFLKGFDSRMASRIHEMAAEKKEREQKIILSTGTALVTVKEVEIDAELRSQGIKLRTVHTSNRVTSSDAYRRGSSAAGSLSINPGVRGNTSQGVLA